MIEAAAQLCCLLLQIRPDSDRSRFQGFIRCTDVACRGKVVPGDRLYLLAKEVSSRHRRFVSLTQGMVDGKLVFEATITGMTM